MRSIENELRRFVIDDFLYGREGGFSNADSFISMGIIDSTGMLEMVRFLEKRYAIQLDDADLIPENLDSVVQMTEFVQRKLQHNGIHLPLTSDAAA